LLEIKIPFKTPSINHLYFNWQNRRILTKEARELKKQIKEIVDTISIDLTLNKQKLIIFVDIHENWFTKDGNIKKKDISNREKFLIDSAFESLGLDDKQIFTHTMRKIQDNEEYSIIIIDTI